MYLVDKLHSGISYSAVGISSVLMNQQYILKKVSLSRNTHKTRIYIYYLFDNSIVPRGSWEPNVVFLSGPVGSLFTNSFIEHGCHGLKSYRNNKC